MYGPVHRSANSAAGIVRTSRDTADCFTHWLASVIAESQISHKQIAAVAHRIVLAGPQISRHQLFTANTRRQLAELIEFDPQHLPLELAIVDGCRKAFPRIHQAACFDSVFHRTMPLTSSVLPIPWDYYQRGVQRYGYHGLSYASLVRQIHSVDSHAAHGRIIVAHLGSGCSLAAIKNGRSVATTMAFTPLAGVVMGGRTGDIDPGLILYIMKRENLAPSDMERWLADNSGLAGIAGCGDMQTLLRRKDVRAKLAVDIFCRSIAHYIGAYASELGGIDAVVFSGGIGEKAPEIRRRIIGRLAFLGLAIDPVANRANRQRISPTGNRVRIWRLTTNEELEMALITKNLLKEVDL